MSSIPGGELVGEPAGSTLLEAGHPVGDEAFSVSSQGFRVASCFPGALSRRQVEQHEGDESLRSVLGLATGYIVGSFASPRCVASWTLDPRHGAPPPATNFR
jgi:hypothetical protein